MTREEQAQYISKKLMENPEFRKAFVGAITDAVNEVVKVINALEQEPCTDAISREDALMALTGEWTDSTDELIHRFIRRIRTLPPVTPAEKVGHWIDGKCNRCGTHAPYWAMASTYYCSEYCPKCGAKMQEVSNE